MNEKEVLDSINEAIRTETTHLFLDSEQLDRLPSEIGEVTNLNCLNISDNKLKEIPPEIGNLTRLESLDISSNRLTSLPKEIGNLTNLRYLNINSNNLVNIPREIGHLSNLEYLDLRSNPMTVVLPEIRKYIDVPEQTAIEIPRYFLQIIEQETDRLFEAKLLIVGEAGAGKTTLAKKIQNENYQLKFTEQSTEGIDIIQWSFPLENGKDFQVNIWDFGGQEIYHATHQFFLTKRSLYILVADSRKEDTDFFYWLNAVDLLSENSPVLIVKNEKQDRKREVNERQLRGEFTSLKEVLATNLLKNRGLMEVKKNLKHYITGLPHVGTELPKTWVKVRRALDNDPRNHITLEEYLGLCQKNGFTRYEDKLQLCEYLHDLGVCLHFSNDELLSRTVILKPTWGTNAVYKVLDNQKIIQNLGKFNQKDLANIWNESQYNSMQAELLQLMLKFKLCYKIPSSHDTYIAPQLLSLNQPEYSWEDNNNLLLRYKYEFMPKGILTRFIVAMHRWIEGQTCVWRTGVLLSKNGARAEIIELYHRREIRIRCVGQRPRDLLAAVRHALDEIHATYERLRYNTLGN